jgi:hypothetical protein
VAADPRQPEITVYVYGQRPQTAPGPSYDPFLLGITPPTRTRPEFFSITGAKLEFPDVPAAPYVETEAFVDQKGKVTTSSGVGGVIGVPHVANIHAGAAILSDGKLMLQAEVEVMGVGMGMFGEYGEAGLYITEGPQIFQGTGVGFQFEDASSAPELP